MRQTLATLAAIAITYGIVFASLHNLNCTVSPTEASSTGWVIGAALLVWCCNPVCGAISCVIVNRMFSK